jgi:hypothetical protein
VTARHDRPVAKIASGKKELGPLSLTGQALSYSSSLGRPTASSRSTHG